MINDLFKTNVYSEERELFIILKSCLILLDYSI